MQFFRRYLITVSLSLLSLTVSVPAFTILSPALAVLSRLKGEVNSGPTKKMSEGFDGKILRNRYRARTEKKSGATIFFNDGSEVRLFGSTEITIGARKGHN